MEDWQIGFIALIIIVILCGAVIYFAFFHETEQGTAQLSVNLDTVSGIAMKVEPLSITISNDGDKANKVEVTLNSQAFGELITDSVDVAANEEETVFVDAMIEDLPNKNYPVTITYTYEGMSETPSPTTEQFYVIPNMRLADVLYLRELGFGPERDTIEQNGNTELNFKVESNSKISTYTQLSASLSCLQSGQSLVITPIETPVEDVGPEGKTENTYTFRIEGNNSPVGTYTLELVLSCDGYEVTTKTRTLYVK